MPSSSVNESNKYYAAGSSEIATETSLVRKKLEKRRILTKTSSRLVIVLVGLPARGKSFVARKITHFLNWTGVKCKIFNVGKYRRDAYAMVQKSKSNSSETGQTGQCDADFFDPKNEEAAVLREQVAECALRDMLRWLDEEEEDEGDESSHHSNVEGISPNFRAKQSGRLNERIAIYDATNSTNKRRQWLLEECTSVAKRGEKTTGIVFVESICDDKELLMENYKFKVSNSPDYQGMSYEASIEDLMKRVYKYEEHYETITDDSLSYIKVFNFSTKLLVNHIYGRMAKVLVPALMAWHIGSRPIFLVRPGQCVSGVTIEGEHNGQSSEVKPSDSSSVDVSPMRIKKKALRGDTLGPSGKKFRADLLEFLHKEVQSFIQKRASVHDMANTGTSISGLASSIYSYYSVLREGDHAQSSDGLDTGALPVRIFTSTMPRALDTVVWDESYNIHISQMSNLNPLDKGDFTGLELEEIREMDPGWYKMLEADPYGTRFPGGESYRDLIRRLSSVVVDLEQQVIPTLVVSHVSILQCLMAYFRNTPIENCMSIEVPMHTVIKFEPVRGGGFQESQHSLGDDSSFPTHTRLNSDCAMNNIGGGPPIWGDHHCLAESP